MARVTAEGRRAEVVIDEVGVTAIRLEAEGFGEAVVAGARLLARRDREGRLSFDAAPVAELHERLKAAVDLGLEGGARALIEARSGQVLERFVDRVVDAWLRAEPAIGEFLVPDRRGSGGFVFEVLRAELDAVGLDLRVAPRLRGTRIYQGTSPRRLFVPVAGTAWLGAMTGWMAELLGVHAGGMLGFALGLALGLAVALRLALVREPARCSECGAAASDLTALSCPGCGTRFADLDDEAVSEEAQAKDSGEDG